MKIIYSFLLLCAILPFTAQRSSANSTDGLLQPAQSSDGLNFKAPAGLSRDTVTDEIITIPVVIHVLYNSSVQNISDEQVLSQIQSLNNDYRKLNNVANIPAVFASHSADAKITFCIAKTDPSGKSTNGIIHKYTNAQSWPAEDQMKFSSAGGDDVWDATKYLNIWVCNLSGNNLGYATLPGSPADRDGVVIQYDVFGTTGTVRYPFDKGRTATHEIGHWLGLMHLWGDAVCGDDHIDDTPPQKSYNNGCPTFPHVSACSVNGSGDMFMNFMDFTDDGCMSMFTYGQKNKMRSMFALGNARNSFLNSTICQAPAAEHVTEPPPAKETIKNSISLYPNPAVNIINIQAVTGTSLTGQTAKIFNVTGSQVKTVLLSSYKNSIPINDFPAGVYFLKIGEGKEVKNMRFVKE